MGFNKEIVLLADIVNYSIKGITAALGKGSGITKSIHPVSLHVTESDTIEVFTETLIKKEKFEDGDAIVIPSKVVAILEKRFVYGLTLKNYYQCISDLEYANTNLKTPDNTLITHKDQIGLDKLDAEKGIGTRYPSNPNRSAFTIAESIHKKTNTKIDVIITDSDSGGIKGIELIGCPTIIVTPIGATGGLRLFYCMRLAVAAELTWNNIPDMPILAVKPYQARFREKIGEFRYEGFLDASKESDILKSLKNDY